jgi:glycosyltransferase involved in cell wall biosynthesis
MASLLVEGWFDIHQSFAIVARHHVRHWMNDPARRIRFRRMPYFGGDWAPSIDASDPVLRFVDANRWDGEPVDNIYRISYPYDTSQPRVARTVYLFMTAELQVLRDENFTAGGVAQFRRAAGEGWLVPVVPSTWCAEALRKIGLANFLVVPHGVDADLFSPREGARVKMSRDRPFTYLSVGGMTPNKGLDKLLRAFLFVHRAEPLTALVLKGHEGLFGSRALFEVELKRMAGARMASPAELDEMRGAIHYVDDDLSDDGMARLYQSADCYVAPYSSEGFCIPALEALAAGLPVIASAGGPTDEFLPEELHATLRVRTKRLSAANGMTMLLVDEEDLIRCMRRAFTDASLRNNARMFGPRHAALHHDWAIVAERLWSLMVAKDPGPHKTGEIP